MKMLSYSCMQEIHQSILDLINNYKYSDDFYNRENLVVRINLEMIEVIDYENIKLYEDGKGFGRIDAKKDYKFTFHSAKTEFKKIGKETYARGCKQYGLLIKYIDIESLKYENSIIKLIDYINKDILKEIEKDFIRDYEKSKRDLFEEFY